MADSYQDDVMFRIGVMDHPETAARLKSLAESVKSTMQEISGSLKIVSTDALNEMDRIRKDMNKIRLESDSYDGASRYGGGSEDVARIQAERNKDIADSIGEISDRTSDAAVSQGIFSGSMEKSIDVAGRLLKEVDGVFKSMSSQGVDLTGATKISDEAIEKLRDVADGVGDAISQGVSLPTEILDIFDGIKNRVDNVLARQEKLSEFGDYAKSLKELQKEWRAIGKDAEDVVLLGSKAGISNEFVDRAKELSKSLEASKQVLDESNPKYTDQKRLLSRCKSRCRSYST